jgi:2-hydroxychromene-2-carboxylate isomerase
MTNGLGDLREIKMYSDYKSPYAYLAFDPAFALADRYHIPLRWIPFQLRLKGKGERSVYSEYKVKYSYLDARRWANKRGGIMLKGPLKIYDSAPALIGGLFAETQGRLQDYSRRVYAAFFRRELEIDQVDAIAGVIAGLGLSADDYRGYVAAEGARRYEEAQTEAASDQIFGVPLFIFEGEPFWGYDRLKLLEERLIEAGLGRAPSPQEEARP